jgi:antitoxin component YwqK of YwqJK toxin-antitoxin module
MKKYMIIGLMLVSGIVFAQDKTPQHQVVGDLVRSTYYYENGKISQEGFYKNGKVHGSWTSYDMNGNKTAIAEYNEGVKTGKWIFWTGTVLSEVDYSDSRIASVKNWKQEAVVNRN